MDIKSIVIAGILGAVGGTGASYLLMEKNQAALDDRLAHIPPVVVVDFAAMAMNYPEGATPEEVDRLMMKTNEAVLKLHEAGYLVIDAGAVVAAPDDLYLPEDVIQ
jgi:hypothetical protein